jgi:membrane protease YdiL (CAAX protease family)
MAGWLSFEWIFVGISEEIMFRGLLQTYLSKTWAGLWIVRGIAVPHAGLITTIIFCLAHISPLHPQVNWEQQLFAFGLGIYYSTVYYRTGSLLNPILAHNFGDGFGVTAAYITYLHLH